MGQQNKGTKREHVPSYRLELDDTNPTITYVGKAYIGAGTTTAVWQIFKMDKTSGLSLTWADGNANFDNTWSNRASLTYS